jgi:hypothetical protein
VELLGIARAPDDLEAEPFLRGGAGGLVTLIAGVGVDQGQPRKAATNPAADFGQAVSILDVGGVDDQNKRQAEGIGEQKAFSAIDRRRRRGQQSPEGTFLPASKPRTPPDSVVLTLWLSMIAALGEASLPVCSRAAIISAIQIRVQVPSCQNRRK